jgi:hypothetical protein
MNKLAFLEGYMSKSAEKPNLTVPVPQAMDDADIQSIIKEL